MSECMECKGGAAGLCRRCWDAREALLRSLVDEVMRLKFRTADLERVIWQMRRAA